MERIVGAFRKFFSSPTVRAIFAALFFQFFILSCSSAPKRVMLVTEKHTLSYSQLDDANNSIAEENFARAFNQLTSAFNLALSIDNSVLLCKISLSGIIFKISVPNLEELIPAVAIQNSADSKSFLTRSPDEILENAKQFASRSEEKDKKILSDLCSVYEVRLSLAKAGGENLSDKDCQKYLSMLENAKSSVAKEPYYLAFLERTAGEVYMASGNYATARKNYENAAAIHTKNRYLFDIALDWYCVARSCSQNEQKSDAIEAIKKALKYDRDAENTNGIASDYTAWSKILLKGNPTAEEIRFSEELALWAEKIRGKRGGSRN